MSRLRKLLNMLLILGPLLVASATGHAESFSELTREQQRVLRNYESNWSNLSAEQQTRLKTGSERWLAMSPEEKRLTMNRFQRWTRPCASTCNLN